MKIPASLLRSRVLLALGLIALGVSGCASNRIEEDKNTVILSITDFDGLPIQVSVNQAALDGGLVQVGEITVSNFPKDPRGATSDLMSVEIDSFEIIYSRADTGTRVPSPRVRTIFGLVPINGSTDLEGLEVVGPEQLFNPPLSDLLLQNGGVDQETGSQLIRLNLQMRFFGKTLAGDSVVSGPDSFTLEFVP